MPSYTVRRARAWIYTHVPPYRPGRRAGKRPVVRLLVMLLLIGAAVFTALNIALYRVKPIIAALAVSEAREYVLLTMNDAIQSEITSGNLLYSEFVTLERDNGGAVTALVTDMTKVNVLQSRISTLVATGIVNMLNQKMSIPLGDAFEGVLFSWEGPALPVRVESVTNVSTQFVNEFDTAGINQTRHTISLTVTADIEIAYTGGYTTATVVSTVPIAETIIVGGVPNIYATPQS